MFLYLSVSHSVHGGCLPQCMLGYPLPQAYTPLGRYPRQTPPCPVHAGIHTPPSRPVHVGIDMATAADGTHPTGMHSCFTTCFGGGIYE